MIPTLLRVLILEDSKSDMLLMVREMRRGGFEVEYTRVETAVTLRATLDNSEWDLILSDYSMPSFQAPEALAIVRQEKNLDTPFIIVSGTIGEDVAVEVMKAGANDYFAKDKLTRLVPAIERELHEVEERRRRRRAEALLRKTEERFAKAFQASPVAIAISRLSDGELLAVNPRFVEVFGYKGQEIIGKTGSELALWTSQEQRHLLIERLRRSERVRNVEIDLRRASGEIVHALLSAEVIELEGEACILSFIQDVTELRRRQKEILETKNLLEKTFAGLGEAVFVIDGMNRRILMCNDAVEDVFGYRPEELIGKSTRLLHLNREMYEQFSIVGDPVLEEGRPFRTQYRMQRKNRKIVHTENTVTLLDVEKGFQAGVVSVVRDITEQKETEARIKRTQERNRLLRDIAVAANEATGVNVILRFAIEKICAFTGWEVGHAYIRRDGEKGTLRSTPIWYLSGNEVFEQFRRDTEENYAVLRRGLVYKVTETHRAEWLDDLSNNPQFIRAEAARRCGLQGGYVFPILTRDQVMGVLEFFSRQASPDVIREVTEVSILIGTQVGRAVERRRAAEKLQESEERYRALFDRSLDAVYIHDFAGNFLDANPTALNLLGYDRDEISQISLQMLVRPEDLDEAMQQVRRTIRRGFQPEISQFPLRRRDGSLVYVEVLSSVIYREGKPWAIQGIARDVTARKKAEQKVKRYTERLELLHEIDRAILNIEAPPVIARRTLGRLKRMLPFLSASVVTVDLEENEATFIALEREGDPIYDVGQTVAIDNQTAVSLLQANRPYIVHDTAQAELVGAEKVLADGGARSYVITPLIFGDELLGAINILADEPHVFSADTVDIMMEVAAQLAIALHNADLYQQVQQHARELEQRVAERTAELQHQKERIETILRSSKDPILLVRQNGAIRRANPAFCTLFDCILSEIIDESFWRIAEIERTERMQQALSQVAARQSSRRIELLAHKPDGEEFEVEAVLSPVENGEERGQEIVCILRDITARKQAEAELRKALQKEKELSELKSSFTSMVSHEFRTPLSVIKVSTDLLLNFSDPRDEKERSRLELINQQVERLTQLMDDVLLLSRGEKSGLKFEPSHIDLLPLCRSIIEEVEMAYSEGRSVDFQFEESCQRRYIDKHLFQHIFQNLLSNAFKYSSPSSTIQVRLTCNEETTTLLVQDEGIGMPAEYRQNLFKSFHRAKNVGAVAGTGLGLAIVKRAVDEHGGAIEVKSKEGEGTTFIVTLPNN